MRGSGVWKSVIVAAVLFVSATAAGAMTPLPGSVAASETLVEIQQSHDFAAGDADTLRLYRAFLNRDPDPGGGVYWIGQSRLGANPDDLAYGFALSDEFIARYGTLDNEAFLTVLYDNMLGRVPDEKGFAYWLGEMNNGLSQPGVVRWIVANEEFVQLYPFTPIDPANPGDVVNCGDFASRSEAQAWHDHYAPAYGDIANLDGDGNGAACESLPS